MTHGIPRKPKGRASLVARRLARGHKKRYQAQATLIDEHNATLINDIAERASRRRLSDKEIAAIVMGPRGDK